MEIMKKMVKVISQKERKLPIHVQLLSTLNQLIGQIDCYSIKPEVLAMIDAVEKKQSIEDVIVNAKKALQYIESKQPKGYYTSDIYQEWIDENHPDYDEKIYQQYRSWQKEEGGY